MCGIAGYSGRGDLDLLRRMNGAIAHRGPDDEGLLEVPEEAVGLAHRRLSIIDLSERGRQPMWDATGRAAIVYNGEIYNYRELRSELVASGFAFQSESDTEVLLNLYLRDGEQMLDKLNGIFAFAIWDPERRSLFLARDGLGVKPLYYAEHDGGLLFASELKALLQAPWLDREIDAEAVRLHMLYLWCPSPATMLRSVRKLEPGTALRVRKGRIERAWRFYDLPMRSERLELRHEEAAEELRRRLRLAVERQLVADVPLGAFLSGGLDSSSVVAMAQAARGDVPLQCFTIGFRSDDAGAEGMAHDLPYARLVARELKSDLHVITVGPEMVDELETMLFHLDEPQADPAPLNALFICRLARQHGIKVLLSGAGGDDILTGYRRHWAVIQEHYWSWLPRPVRQGLVGLSRSIRPSTETRRRVAKALRYADLEGDERVASYFYWLPPDLLASLLSPALRDQLRGSSEADPLLDALFHVPENRHALERMLYLESRFFLTDHNLNYADKMSMASGVEVRVPFLDPDLVAFATALPSDYKQRGRTGKWILRKAMEPILPREVLHRKKTGFGAPLRAWLRKDLREVVDDVLSERSLASRGLFNPAGVRELIRLDREGRLDAAYSIFSMVCIELWCRMFVDRTPPQAVAVAAVAA